MHPGHKDVFFDIKELTSLSRKCTNVAKSHLEWAVSSGCAP